jgi:hypothetical protein
MNQLQKRDLILSALEARNLHADIFALLTQIAELTDEPKNINSITQISMDGGGFR